VADAAENERRHEAHPDLSDATPHLVALRVALIRYQLNGSPAALDDAFAAAAAGSAVRRGRRHAEPVDADEARSLMAQMPEFEELVLAAVGAAERSAHAAACELWSWFGLSSAAPTWDPTERSGAQILVACACAPLDVRGAAWLRPRLLRLASRRWAAILMTELTAGNDGLWRRVLGERYESVHECCAPRSKWRTRELSELLISNERTAGALSDRLTRWLAQGGDFHTLPGELEAAFVLTRTPARIA